MISAAFVFTSNAYEGKYYDQIPGKTVLTATTGKDTYAPGDKFTLSMSITECWGDPEVQDYVDYITDTFGEIPVAGLYTIQSLAYQINLPGGIKSTALTGPKKSNNNEISNWEYASATLFGNKTADYFGVLIGSDNVTFDEGDEWLISRGFYGTGEIATIALQIPEDIEPGSYEFTVKYDDWTDFFDNPIAIDYRFPTIVIEGDEPIITDDPTPVEPMEIKAADVAESVNPGDTFEIKVDIANNEGVTLDLLSSAVSYDNTVFELVGIESAYGTSTTSDAAIAAANKQSDKIEDLGNKTSVNVDFEDAAEITADGTAYSIKFKVLPTAVAGEHTVDCVSIGGENFGSAKVTVGGGHAHEWTSEVTDPTCTDPGFTVKTCSCGLSFTTDPVSALGHKASTNPADITRVEPSCRNNNGTHEKVNGRIVTLCSVCGKTAKVETIEAPEFELTESDVEVSCTTDGYHLTACKNCDWSEKTNFVAKIGHKYDDGTEAWGEVFIARYPSARVKGQYGQKCALCGDIKYGNYMDWDHLNNPAEGLQNFGDCNMKAFGDANGDGKITVADVTCILKYLAKWDNPINLDSADVMIDGSYSKNQKDDTFFKTYGLDTDDVNKAYYQPKISNLDVTRLLKYLAKWDGITLGYAPQPIQ